MCALACLALLTCAVPAEDEPIAPPDITGEWISTCYGFDDYHLIVRRDPDGTLHTTWHELGGGAVTYRGTLAWDAKAGRWRESYWQSPGPEFARRCEWVESGAGFRSEPESFWTLRRMPPDL